MSEKVFYHDDNDKLRVFTTDTPGKKVRTTTEDLNPNARGPVVRKSRIGGAGNGLYAARTYNKGALVTKYGGKLLSDSQVKRSASKYVMTDDHGRHHDSRLVDKPDSEKGRWINDPRGTGLAPNVEAVTTAAGVLIKTTRTVAPGEEFYLDYGDRYWG